MDWNPIKKLNTTVKTSFNLARPLTEKKGWWSVETGLLKSWCREDASSINPLVGLRWNRCLRPKRDQLLTTVSGINRQLVLLLSKVHQNVVVPENCGKLLDNLPRYVRTLKAPESMASYLVTSSKCNQNAYTFSKTPVPETCGKTTC